MDDTPLLPARMLNEYAYCPRLFALEWLHAEWADSSDTEHGRTVHRRVDTPTTVALPDPKAGKDEPPRAVRSVYLGDEDLGLVAKIDLVEVEGNRVSPLDVKQGRPRRDGDAWEPEKVQICAQALLLRAHGYTVEEGTLWFAAARRRVVVPIDHALVRRTLALRDEALALARHGGLPPPLVDSPKCPRCSLVGICLPDETNTLLGRATQQVRPLVPARADGQPLVVQIPGGRVGKKANEIVARDRDGEVGRARIGDTSEVVLMGNVSVSAQLLRALAERDIPVSWHSFGGWYVGTFTGMGGRNALWRIAQHALCANPDRALAVARELVVAKIHNQRILLRRNGKDLPPGVLDHLADHAREASKTPSMAVLLGLEGRSARLYFESFPVEGELGEAFAASGRTRRPPRDPVNAMLSFGYAVLTRTCAITAHRVGLDPYVGVLHQPRFGRPALALDLMEPFRPLIVDSAVLTAVNTGELRAEHFRVHPTGCTLTDAGRKRFIGVLQRRLDAQATHPELGTRLSYRRILEVQARLFARVATGELEHYPGFKVR